MYYFCSNWRSKELNHPATGGLKNCKTGMKRGQEHLLRSVVGEGVVALKCLLYFG